MEALDRTLFLWLNAPAHPSALALTLAVLFAERIIWAVPLFGIGCAARLHADRDPAVQAAGSQNGTLMK